MSQPNGIFADGTKHLLGRGAVFVDRKLAGVSQGERHLGNCTAFTITPSEETRDITGFVNNANPLLASVPVKRTLEVNITLREYDENNLALALFGDVATLGTQGSGSITNEVKTYVAKDRWYKLVKRNVSAVAVTGLAGTPTYVLGTDYEVDAKVGRIYVKPASAIAGNFEVDYSYADDNLANVKLGTAGTIECFIRFVPDAMNGPQLEAELWRVIVGGDGETGLITDDYGEVRIKGLIIDDSTNHATTPFGQLIKR